MRWKQAVTNGKHMRALIGIAVVAGTIAIAAPIAASLYWAQRQTVDEQFTSAEAVANEVARRVALAVEQMAEAEGDEYLEGGVH